MKDQAAQALAKALRVRIERAELKRSLAGERLSITQILRDPPPCARTATILDALTWARSMGEKKARTVLRIAKVREGRRLGHLTRDERLRIELALRQRCARSWARWQKVAA